MQLFWRIFSKLVLFFPIFEPPKSQWVLSRVPQSRVNTTNN